MYPKVAHKVTTAILLKTMKYKKSSNNSATFVKIFFAKNFQKLAQSGHSDRDRPFQHFCIGDGVSSYTSINS